MKLIRSLVFPWFVFFVAAVTALVILGVRFPHIPVKTHPLYGVLFGAGAVLCLLANLRSLGNVGIWMLESLPDSLRYTSSRWIFRAFKAAAIAAVFWFVGRLPWVPLVWQGVVIPTVFTICLFVLIFSLIGPILKFSANMAWSRAFSIILSLPILAAVPATAAFIGQNIVTAYRASQPNLVIAADPNAASQQTQTSATTPQDPAAAAESAKIAALKDQEITSWLRVGKPEQKALALRALNERKPLCAERTREVIAALDAKGPTDNVLWAVKAVDCADVRAVVAMPRLAQIMVEHESPEVRANAIRAMKKYGNENVRQIAYLLVKRINENEPPEVVEAAASALAPLGPEQQRWSANRLKGLLGSGDATTGAAKALIQIFGRDDLVAEYVSQNLTGPEDRRRQAMEMICLLPKAKREIADPHIATVVSFVKTADENDPGLKALRCMGRTGFQAIRAELNEPKHLKKPIAARALALMNAKDAPDAEVLEVASQCAQDQDTEVRTLCSQTLGHIGAPALPKILELLQSGDKELKDAGRIALQNFDDPEARDELQKIRADNSGWMANNKKLEIAKAVGTALQKLQTRAEPQG